MTKIYRAVLAGTGGIADAHVRAVDSTRGRVELVAAMDVDAARLRAFGERHPGRRLFADYGEMIRETRPDLVIIATPPRHPRADGRGRNGGGGARLE